MPKKIYHKQNNVITAIHCDTIILQLTDEKRLEIFPHDEKREGYVVFSCVCIDEQEQQIMDRYASFNIDLMCSNKILLTVNTQDARLGEKFINMTHLDYPKLCFSEQNQKKIFTTLDPSESKIIIEMNAEFALIIEYAKGRDYIMVLSENLQGVNNEKFPRLALEPGACNTLHVSIIS